MASCSVASRVTTSSERSGLNDRKLCTKGSTSNTSKFSAAYFSSRKVLQLFIFFLSFVLTPAISEIINDKESSFLQ